MAIVRFDFGLAYVNWHLMVVGMIQKAAAVIQHYRGLGIAIAILLFWLGSFVTLCAVPLAEFSLLLLSLGIFARAFAHTGLFVVAHDAMHRTLVPNHRWLNDQLGTLAVGLYAALPYQQCRLNHGKHHQHPAQAEDPDFHDGVHRHPLLWYIRFLKGYLSWSWLIRFGCQVSLMGWIGHLSRANVQSAMVHLLLFWLLPLFLSSLQLFFFGTYLPHRQGLNPIAKPPQGFTRAGLTLWSLLSCYHFGYYHWEHHQSPKTPWYQLPTL
jgi:beta-carotene/zeaxanthin 4-ketolase